MPPVVRLLLAGLLAATVVPLGIAYAGVTDPKPDDSTFVTDGRVEAIAHAGGRTFIGGAFEHVGPRVGHGAPFPTGGGGAVAGTFPEVAGGEIHAVEPAVGGGWFIGGDFTHVGGKARARLAHISSSGEVTDWNPGANDRVLALALEGNDLYVGGSFTQVSGQDRNRLAAVAASTGVLRDWNPDANNVVRALTATTITIDLTGGGTHDNTLVFVGGEFTQIPTGTTNPARNRLAAIWGVGAKNKGDDQDQSSLEGTVVSGPSITTVNTAVRAVAVGAVRAGTGATGSTENDRFVPVYFGGDFPAPKTFLGAAQFSVRNARGPDNFIINFTTANSQRYSPWTPIPAAANGGGPVRALAVDSTTEPETVYAGGDFAQAGQTPQPRNRVAAFTGIPAAEVVNLLSGTAGNCPTPGCPATVKEGWKPDADDRVSALAVSGSTIFAGGWFTKIGGAERNGMAALNAVDAPAEGQATAWNPRLAGCTSVTGPTHRCLFGAVNALAATGSHVYAGGSFTSAGATKRSRLAALRPNGELDTGWSPPEVKNGRVLALTAAHGVVYAGGMFTAPRNRLAAFSAQTGSLDSWNPGGIDCSDCAPGVLALDVSAEHVYVGGGFTEIGNVGRKGAAAVGRAGGPASGQIAAWNPQALDPPGDLGKSAQVYGIEASCTDASSDVIYAGGNFGKIGGQDLPRLAALDAVTGQALSWDPNETGGGVVRDLALSPDRQLLYVGGGGFTFGGKSRLAALRTTNATATDWNPGVGATVLAVGVTGDGQTVVAGGSGQFSGQESLAAYDAASGDLVGWNPAPNARVDALDVSKDNVYIGGPFTGVGARAQQGVATFTSGLSADPPILHKCQSPVASVVVEETQTEVVAAPPPPPPPPPPPEEPDLRHPAELEVTRAKIGNGRLLVRGSLDPLAAGRELFVRIVANKEPLRVRPTVAEDGSFEIDRRLLPGPQRRARSGRLLVRFDGTTELRPAGVRLRAARRPVRLRFDRVQIRPEELMVVGQVAARARKKPARIEIEWSAPDGEPAAMVVRVAVNKLGRFRLRQPIPAAVRQNGAHVSLTHPGRARLHGQRRGRAVLGAAR